MGHSVLLVPVPELEAFVAGRSAHYDPAWLSADPTFVHAHITLLAPFVHPRQLRDGAAERLRRVLDGAAAFDFELSAFGTFPDGVVYLSPEPAGPFAELTAALCAAFPDFPPYAGEFPQPVPHLTLDMVGDGVTEEGVRRAVDPVMPARCRAAEVHLAWYEAGNCHVVDRWPLRRPL